MALKPCFLAVSHWRNQLNTFKVNIFKEAVVCSKEHKMTGFCEFPSVVVRKLKSSMEIDIYIWHNTDTVLLCVSSSVIMSVLMAQAEGQEVFWQQILGFQSLNSFILTIWQCLENLQSWGDFLLILWTTLGSYSRSEEMIFPSHSSSQVQNGGCISSAFECISSLLFTLLCVWVTQMVLLKSGCCYSTSVWFSNYGSLFWVVTVSAFTCTV